MRIREPILAAVVLALAAGCGGKDAPAKPTADAPVTRDHVAPHGGSLVELGEEEAHVELVHDPKASTLTAYVYGADGKTPLAVEAPVLLLKGGVEVALTAATAGSPGTGDTWKVTHPALASDPLEGRIRVKVAGKSLQAPLEDAAHGH